VKEDASTDPEELAALEAEEVQVSAERRRLQQTIDNGFGTELTRARERDLSRRRRALHHRIDVLRGQMGLPVGPQRGPSDDPALERTWSAFEAHS
jgi:hypothetical protein